MPTPDQIDEQVRFEREAIKHGLNKLLKNTKDLEDKQYASATTYGAASMDIALPLVTEWIKQTTNKLYKGQAGASFKEIHAYLKDLEPLAAASIAVKLTFDKVFTAKDRSNTVVKVTESIGRAIEDECQMQYYERICPGLLKTSKITTGTVRVVHTRS